MTITGSKQATEQFNHLLLFRSLTFVIKFVEIRELFLKREVRFARAQQQLF